MCVCVCVCAKSFCTIEKQFLRENCYSNQIVNWVIICSNRVAIIII